MIIILNVNCVISSAAFLINTATSFIPQPGRMGFFNPHLSKKPHLQVVTTKFSKTMCTLTTLPKYRGARVFTVRDSKYKLSFII